MTDAVLHAGPRAPVAAQAHALVRRRMWLAILAPLAVLGYLTYTWFAFDVNRLIARADANRAMLLGVDSLFHKIHVEENLRRGDFTVAIEGERTSTFRDPESYPDWVRKTGPSAVEIDMGGGYAVRIDGPALRFDVPGYGSILVRVTEDGIVSELPPGPAPDWISGDARKFDARPTFDRRVQVSRSKIEVHRYFFGWENFWFPFGSPFWGTSWGERWHLAFVAPRLDPARSNLSYMWSEFLRNPDWQHGHVFVALFETMLMAVLGTVVAVLLALPLAFLAASNFTPSLALRFGVRRLFDFVRAVDSLIWSLIFIRAFGLGPLTGSLAIAITDMGSLGKLFSEALENIDGKQVEGVESVGASAVQAWRFGVIPQIMPVLMSQTLYYLESNTRSATVIGALGAGGIGLVLVETMRTARDWENTAYIIVLIVALVVVMDSLSGWLRQRLIIGKPQ